VLILLTGGWAVIIVGPIPRSVRSMPNKTVLAAALWALMFLPSVSGLAKGFYDDAAVSPASREQSAEVVLNGSQDESPKLHARVVQTDVPSQSSWMDAPVEVLNDSFMQYSSIGGPDLVNEIPKDFFAVISKYDGSWSHSADQTPGAEVLCPNWNSWLFEVNAAMFQIRWELWTDPKQKVCVLGSRMGHPHGSPMWQKPGRALDGVIISNCWEPGLSHHAYFKGGARVLVEVHPNRRLDSKVLVSSLPPDVTARLKQSIEALNGHPALTYPATGTKYGTVAMIFDFGFDDPEAIK
jgi:hypothetical protein